MEFLVAILVPLGGMALTFGIVYYVVNANHKERMRLIESGADPELFYSKKRKRGQAIKFAALLIGVGIGIVLGDAFANMNLLSDDVAYPALVLICGGVGLLLGNHYATKLDKENDTES